MKLCELSDGYRETAKVLRKRLSLWRKMIAESDDPELRSFLRARIKSNEPILTQCYELQELTAHYYERGYKRNGRYTL